MKRKIFIIASIVLLFCIVSVSTYAVARGKDRNDIDPNKKEERDRFTEIILEKKENESKNVLQNIPVYHEDDLFFKTDGLFFLGRDACFYDFQNARQNYTGAIMEAYPDSAIRERKDGSVYLVFDADTGYRLFLLLNDKKSNNVPQGFPIVVGKILSFQDFTSLEYGDSIERVEEIDSIASLYKKQFLEIWKLTATDVAAIAKEGYPCTSVHYLKDGLLIIEYGEIKDNHLCITNMIFSKDYTLTNARGELIDYNINDLDLPSF